ncbi:MAG: arachidonate 15-lipoxygenase [Alteromonadaceae bacterium]|nr:arachidonate 15-lipoxygenase [Alteromonadaceae bacterium]
MNDKKSTEIISTRLPSLPQKDTEKEQNQRAFDISLAQTKYNYMFSYLEPLPISADVPHDEKFTPAYDIKAFEVLLPMLENFKDVIFALIDKEIASDLPFEATKSVENIKEAFNKIKNEKNIFKKIADYFKLFKLLFKLPEELESAVKNITYLPSDLFRIINGLEKVFKQFEEEGFTAFLKNTLYDTLDTQKGRDYLQAKTLNDYLKLFDSLPKPLTLKVKPQSWMDLKDQQEPWQQDWYFAYLQIAGFNTTNLKGVQLDKNTSHKVIVFDELLDKMPITDEIFQKVTGIDDASLIDAAKNGLLYACDYSMFDSIPGGELHQLKRYPTAPIALFYWNTEPSTGYPSTGALQPIAIQLGQKHDLKSTPIFTPNDCTENNDKNGLKWQLAKLIVQSTCAIQHETVAHLEACHLTIEPMIVASHRQLSEHHPLMVLLKPHFQFTIQVNDSAIHSLIVPGGVVASVLSTSNKGSDQLIVDAYKDWKFDEQFPDRLFKQRGVSEDTLISFPFREDTLEIWHSIKHFVKNYLSLYYGDTTQERDNNIQDDTELQKWINEMVSKKYASVKGMSELVKTDDKKMPYKIDSFDYLVEVVSLIIYTASAQHASVNYAQYPLMSYVPSVTGTIYHTPPNSCETLTEKEVLKWLPPLDVSLYQVSFLYLLSNVQYDTLGHYSDNPRKPYFKDHDVDNLVIDFKIRLNEIEKKIHHRNKTRPFPYLMQLPSMIPNSISI